jgi:hypothetical protein
MRTTPLLLALLVLLATRVAGGQLLVNPAGGPPGEETIPCLPDKKPCVFTDLQGENTYRIDKQSLQRLVGGQQAYSVPLAPRGVTLLAAAINKQRTQIAVALEVVSISTGRLLSGGPMLPDEIHRQHFVSLRNPKTGEEIKSIELGMFKPSMVSLAAAGDYVWVAGSELQLRRGEVRAFNARSGKMEHSTVVGKNASIGLYERGYRVANTYYAADLDTGGAVRRHNSPNGFSIAEFTVRRPTPLKQGAMADAFIGVVGFRGGSEELREMLDSSLAIKMQGAGFRMVERKRMKELLQEARFQGLGLTDASRAAELGKLANAQYLLFGEIRSTGSTSLLTVSVVGVESGAVQNGAELECRDCKPDDYLQGLTFLLQDWIEPVQ